MARWETHRSDGNADEIYKAARKLGFSVEKLNRPVDALLGIYDQSVAVEVKMPKGTLEPDQVKFFRTFKGMKAILRSVEDLIALHKELRERHDVLWSTVTVEGTAKCE